VGFAARLQFERRLAFRHHKLQPGGHGLAAQIGIALARTWAAWLMTS
jgi:hypothetical protein